MTQHLVPPAPATGSSASCSAAPATTAGGSTSGSDRIDVPDLPFGHVGVMMYEPYFVKSRGVWVPGAFPQSTSFLHGPWLDFWTSFRDYAKEVPSKGEQVAFSTGKLVDQADKRANHNVQCIAGLTVLDVDSGAANAMYVRGLLDADGLEYFMFATYSNGLPGKGIRVKFVILLTETVPAVMASKFKRAMLHKYTRDATGKLAADASCVDISRVHYMPGWAPGNAHNFAFEHHPGVPLPIEEIYDFIGDTSTVVAMAKSDGERVSSIENARTVLSPAQRSFAREDLEKLAKNKKANLTAQHRTALKHAAQGERMVVVKGERDPATTRQGVSNGGDLANEDIDAFLTSLMFQLAVHTRNADPLEVQRVFAPSLSLLQDDDSAAGNLPYPDDALRKKFESGVRKADEKSVGDAKKAGLPTFEEFKAEQGITDEGDLSASLPGRVFLGARCVYCVRMGADGEPKLVPVWRCTPSGTA